MGKKVYDPIHDVFQDQNESGSESRLTSTDIRTPSHGQQETGEKESLDEESMNEENEETGDDSTESDDTTNNLPQSELSMVPSVTTSKKKMKESSKYNRHLKKPDGEFFTRKDLQFHFLNQLLIDKRQIFTNIYKDVYAKSVVPLPSVEGKVLNVTDEDYDARTFIFNDKLTFSQIYLLTLASSTKCSKVLRDKLLLDHQVAFSTCILGLLVNIGRLNTTINFFLEMTSQLRTFHSVPCLQYKVTDLKSLQDTPRLKSILKNLPVGNNPINLSKMYDSPGSFGSEEKFNVVNLLFRMCDSVTLVNLKLISKYVGTKGEPVSLFNILDSPGYEPEDRCNVLLWLLYIHAETDLSEEEIRKAIGLFTNEERIPLERTNEDYDADPADEYEFGMEQNMKRKEFLKRIQGDDDKQQNEPPIEEDEQEQDDEEENTDGKKGEENDDTLMEDHSPDGEVMESTPTQLGTDNSVNQTVVKGNLKGKRKASSAKNEQQDSEVVEKKIRGGKKRKTSEGVKKEETQTVDSNSKMVQGKITVSANALGRSSKNAHKPESVNRIENLIEVDREKIVGKITHVAKTQETFLKDLIKSQIPVNLKRKDLGLVKIFNEYEDIPMASVIGIRGKKRKKFKDNVLGFETDYLRNFAAAKRVMLQQGEDAIDDEVQDSFVL